MDNPKPNVLTVTEGNYFRVGDLIRVSSTGEVLLVTSAHGGEARRTRRVPLWRAVWRWLRRRGWQRKEVVERYGHTLRVWRWRPSPLPRRLP